MLQNCTLPHVEDLIRVFANLLLLLLSPASKRRSPGQWRGLKYKFVSRVPQTRFRSIRPVDANSFSFCLTLAGDHMPKCLQSNGPATAFSSPMEQALFRRLGYSY